MAEVAPSRSGQRGWKRFADEFVFFAWWVRLQRRVEEWSVPARAWLLGITIAVGVIARFWAQTLPGNWDFGQWINVSTAALDGQDPYALYGYNYPPPWLLTLTLFNAVTSSTESFRLLIAILLAIIDIGIVMLLVRRGYMLAAVLFFLSPITIAISGWHQQVDGIAVFFALAAVTALGSADRSRITGRDWLAVLLLGISLGFKPVFLLFPLWLALRPGDVRRRAFLFVGPIVVFGVIFASAFLVYPVREVLQKVLGHGGANNSPFVNAFVPGQLAPWVLDHGGGKLLFILALVAVGWMFRRLPPFELALAYSISAVLFSWAVVNQYLVTPMAAVAVFMNIGFLIWLGLSTLNFSGPEALNIPILRDIQPHVLLEWTQVMQDLFPWLLIGWLLFVLALRRAGLHMNPRAGRSERVL